MKSVVVSNGHNKEAAEPKKASQQRAARSQLKFIQFDAAKQKTKHKTTPPRPGVSKYRSMTSQHAREAVYGSSAVLVLDGNGVSQRPRNDEYEDETLIPIQDKSYDYTQYSFCDLDNSSSEYTPHRRFPSPTSILRKGNSDPFGTYPVSVDPVVNDLVAFYRDFVLCGKHNLAPGSYSTSPTAMREWAGCVEDLQDDCSAYGFLARNATVLAVIKQDSFVSQRALTFRSQCTTALRLRFIDTKACFSPRTISSIQALAGAEVLARNAHGAAIHCKMLSFLFTERAAREEFDLGLLTFALYIDIMRAVTFLEPPSFDVSEWLPSVYQASWQSVASSLPPLGSAPSTVIDPAVSPKILRSIFRTFRKTTKAGLTFAPFQKPAPRLVVNWYLSHSLIAQGQLINYYLGEAHFSRTTDGLLSADFCAHAYMALAALYWVRLQGMWSPTVCGVKLWPGEASLHAHLKEALMSSEALVDHVVRPVYRNSFLWALYVGAYAERLCAKDGLDVTEEWFNSRIANQAGAMNVRSWQQLRQILQGFLYNDHFQPHLSSWFPVASAGMQVGHQLQRR